ncbi:MAG: DNA-directed RNA polymerase subunit P [Candidatus Nanoarchaeia archaeon]|nr:DNA-directed RNA polymerase subunit P [Candidatus Nanoarchaeia archaeon]
MSEYKCLNCGRVIEKEDILRRVRCVYCGSKILFKEKPTIVKKLKAR